MLFLKRQIFRFPIILIHVAILLLSCDTELLEFDKLSQKTSLTPSFRLPVAKADIHLNSFLDSLDFDVDYDRDDYATIYISDTIHKLLEISMEDLYDPIDFSTGVESTYTLPPIELENTSNDFDRITMSQATQLPNGTTTVIPPFQATIVLGTIDMYNEPYGSARFFDGSIEFIVTNQFPIDTDVKVLLYGENDQLITSSETFSVAKNTSERSSIQIDGLTISKQIEARLEIQSSGSTDPLIVDSESQFIDTQINLSDASVDQLELNQSESFNYAFSNDIELDDDDGISHVQIFLEKGLMDLEFLNQIGHPVELNISSDELTVDGDPLQLQHTVLGNGQIQVFSEELINTSIEFTTNPATGNSQFSLDFDLTLNLQQGDILESNRDIRYKTSFEVVDFKYEYGNFPPKQHMVTDSILINQNLSDLYNKASIVDPKLVFTAHNSFGFPLSFSFDAFGKRNDGSQIEFVSDNNSKDIDAPAQLYDFTKTTWFYDRSNSSLDEWISFFADDEIEIEATVEGNPNETKNNFIHDGSEFWIDVYAEAPMHFNINNVEILDTLAIETPIDTSDLGQILEATLHLDYRSELPLEVQLRTQMIDTLSQTLYFELDPLLLNPATVSDIGEVIEPSSGRMTISLTQDEIGKLEDVNGIPLEITINSTDAESKDVKIYANSTFELLVQLEVKIELDE